MNDTVTFGVFNQSLRQLGFREGIVPGSHVYYEHPESGTVIMARLHKAKDLVPWHTFASTRKILIERGVVTPEEFEQLTGLAAHETGANSTRTRGRRSQRAAKRGLAPGPITTSSTANSN